MRIENGFCIIQDDQHFLRGQECPKGSQILQVLDARADDVGEATQEVDAGGRELVTPNESTVVAKPLLDLIVVEDGEGDGGFADSTGTNEGNRNKTLSEINYLLDQLVASEEGPRW